jgi:hypothetical protein
MYPTKEQHIFLQKYVNQYGMDNSWTQWSANYLNMKLTEEEKKK